MSGGRFGSASGLRRTINATLSPFKSFRQITPSHRRHIPVRRERCIKGDGFLRASDRKVPAGKCRILKGGREGGFDGEAEIKTKRQFRLDFRERVSRSIWPSKQGLSCYRILPARGILSFGGKVRLLLYVSAGRGKGYLFSKKFPSLAAFFNAAFVGEPSGLS